MTIDNVTNKTNDKNRRRRRRRARKDDADESVEITAGQTARKDRPTPSRRESNGKSSNLVTRSFRAIGGYLGETRDELQKVTWPSRQDSMRLSGIVLAVTIAFSIGLGILDYLYGELFALGFGESPNSWLAFVVFGVVVIVLITVGLRWLRRHS